MNVSLRALIPEGVVLPEGKLLLAFSGGSDSLFLMIVLSLLAKDRTEALYVNHSLRSRDELDREIELNKKNAAILGIPLHIVSVPDGVIRERARARCVGIEAAAREIRYSILHDAAESGGFSYILTAHHREDQVETVLMRMLSSSPFYSYQGILRCDGNVYRPILSVSKMEILSFLHSSGMEWTEDSTNNDDTYLRNRIRHGLLSSVSEEERLLISSIAENVMVFRRRFPAIKCYGRVPVQLRRHDFLSSFPFQRDEAIYRILGSLELSERVSRKTIAEIVSKAQKGEGKMLVSSMAIYFSKDAISFYPLIDDFAVEYKGADMVVGTLSLKHPTEPDNLTICLDENLFYPPVVLRTSREGDRIELRDGIRKVSELEKNMRLPYSVVLEDRKGIAVVFSRFLNGRDRLAKRFLASDRKGTALAIEIE